MLGMLKCFFGFHRYAHRDWWLYPCEPKEGEWMPPHYVIRETGCKRPGCRLQLWGR